MENRNEENTDELCGEKEANPFYSQFDFSFFSNSFALIKIKFLLASFEYKVSCGYLFTAVLLSVLCLPNILKGFSILALSFGMLNLRATENH